MSENETKQTGKRDTIRIILIVAIIIVAAGAGYKIYTDSLDRKALQAEFDATKTELNEQLESIGAELSDKIREIAELGGNIDSLVILKDSITAERDQLQRTRRANKKLIQRLDRKVTGYQELLVAKDKEIEELKELNTALLEENTDLKEDKNELNATIRQAQEREDALQQQVNLAA